MGSSEVERRVKGGLRMKEWNVGDGGEGEEEEEVGSQRSIDRKADRRRERVQREPGPGVYKKTKDELAGGRWGGKSARRRRREEEEVELDRGGRTFSFLVEKGLAREREVLCLLRFDGYFVSEGYPVWKEQPDLILKSKEPGVEEEEGRGDQTSSWTSSCRGRRGGVDMRKRRRRDEEEGGDEEVSESCSIGRS